MNGWPIFAREIGFLILSFAPTRVQRFMRVFLSQDVQLLSSHEVSTRPRGLEVIGTAEFPVETFLFCPRKQSSLFFYNREGYDSISLFFWS